MFGSRGKTGGKRRRFFGLAATLLLLLALALAACAPADEEVTPITTPEDGTPGLPEAGGDEEEGATPVPEDFTAPDVLTPGAGTPGEGEGTTPTPEGFATAEALTPGAEEGTTPIPEDFPTPEVLTPEFGTGTPTPGLTGLFTPTPEAGAVATRVVTATPGISDLVTATPSAGDLVTATPRAGIGTATPSAGDLVTATPQAGTLPPAGAGEMAVEVWIDDNRFDPRVLTIPAGTTVTWINRDSTSHTVTFGRRDAPNREFDEYFRIDERISYTFSEPGIYHYYSGVHPDANGTVIVVQQ